VRGEHTSLGVRETSDTRYRGDGVMGRPGELGRWSQMGRYTQLGRGRVVGRSGEV